METIDDMRDLREFKICHHNEMPKAFPISDEGFERQYTFKMTRGARNLIDLVVEETSFVRVVISERTAERNEVEVVLHAPGSKLEDRNDQPLAQTSKDKKTIAKVLNANKKPYLLEILFPLLDEEDPCALFDFHVAIKPLKQVPSENLACMGYKMPPDTIKVEEGKKTTKVAAFAAISDQYVSEKNNKGSFSEFDILIELPHSDFLVDIELKTDFLSNRMQMLLYALEEKGDGSQSWHRMAVSEWVNERRYEDISIDADDTLATTVGELTMVQKMRYVEDFPIEVAQRATTLKLTLRLVGKPVLDLLQLNQLYEPSRDTLCFNFFLSLFIDEISTRHLQDEQSNQMVRVDWQGREQALGEFDTNQRITAFIEFEKSISKHMPQMKMTFEETIFLLPLDKLMKPDKAAKRIPPTHFKTKQGSDDTLVLSFAPYTLEKDRCYKLVFGPDPAVDGTGLGAEVYFPSNPLKSMISKEMMDSDDMRICTSSCNCDGLGTAQCLKLDSGAHMCHCHAKFTGDDCSKCVEGYFRNSDGFCEKTGVCADQGGDEDCNGHGKCEQVGPTAVCQCDPGFAHDGLDQCGRCQDPLMAYPDQCAKSRNWVTLQDDSECEKLMHAMPRLLFRDSKEKSGGGLENLTHTIYQQENGVCEWAGRYALLRSNFASQDRFFAKDNAANIDSEFVKKTTHAFFIQMTSVYQIHLNALDSGVKLRY